MFDAITRGFRDIKNRLQGKRELTEANIEEALEDIRRSLLEADVNFHVVKRFLGRVKERALGEVVQVKVKTKAGEVHQASPGQHFIKICQDELENLMGPVEDDPIKMAAGKDPTKIMLVGLQGSGKTTTAGKLARWLQETMQGKPMLVAADVYRPAAIKQLQVLGEQLGVPVYTDPDGDPPEICEAALAEAKKRNCNFIIFDTAGRLAVDDILMSELEEIAELTTPENIFLVCDSMIGRDAVNTAVQFNDRLSLHGFIMTKLDGDARGGAALSIKEVTGKPIKFVGEGEHLDKLKEFRPDGLASRILGFGDIVDVMMDFERIVDEDKAERDAEDMLSGNFNFNHFLEQIKTIQQMGSLRDLFERMPFFSGIADKVNIDDNELVRIQALINSMTRAERENPDLLTRSKSRMLRIARGSGRAGKDGNNRTRGNNIGEVEDLIRRFSVMREMMSRLGQNTGWMSKIPGLKTVNTYRQLKNMDLNDVFGSILQQATGPGGMGGMPGMPGMPGMGGGMALPPGLPKGYTPPGFKPQGHGGTKKNKKQRKLARDKKPKHK